MLRVAFVLRSTEVHPVFLDLFAYAWLQPPLITLAKKNAHLREQVGRVDDNFLGENKSEEHRLNLSGS